MSGPSWRRRLLFIPPVAAGIAAIAFAVSSRDAPVTVQPEERQHTVRVMPLEPTSFVPRITGFGTVEPVRTWRAIAQVDGRISYIHPEFIHGGTVREGELLIRIADEDYRLAIAQAQAELGNIDAELERSRATIGTTEKSLEIEKDALDLSIREFRRQSELVQRNVASASVSEEKEQAMLAQRVRVQELENQLSLMPVELEALEQSKAVAQAKLEVARLDLERTELKAPFDARISFADIEVNQYAARGGVMGELDGINAAEINVQIAPRQMAGFVGMALRGAEPPPDARAGQVPAAANFQAKVRVGFAGEGSARQGQVTRISDTVDPSTRSIGVIVRVDQPYANIEPGRRPPLIKGMFAEVEIMSSEIAGALVVPRAAIRDERIMVVGPDKRLAFVEVVLRHVQDDLAVIDPQTAAGVDLAGASVIISDLSPAIEGMLLLPVLDQEAIDLLRVAAGTRDLIQ